MSPSTVTKKEIIEELDALSPETFPELQAFIQFLRFKSERGSGEDRARSRQERWRSALEATFGMWADRDDIPDDAVVYVNESRRGRRLNAMEVR